MQNSKIFIPVPFCTRLTPLPPPAYQQGTNWCPTKRGGGGTAVGRWVSVLGCKYCYAEKIIVRQPPLPTPAFQLGGA